MVLVSMLVDGSLFILVSGPPIYLWIKEQHFGTVHELYREGVLPIWVQMQDSSAGIFPVSVMVFGFLLVGLLL